MKENYRRTIWLGVENISAKWQVDIVDKPCYNCVMMGEVQKVELNVRRVSMKKLMSVFVVVLALVLAPVTIVYAAEATLMWDANTEEDLAGYRIFYRQSNENYNYSTPNWEGTAVTCVIQNLTGVRDYLFVARAFDEDGNESDNSNEVRYKNSPGAPCMLRFP